MSSAVCWRSSVRVAIMFLLSAYIRTRTVSVSRLAPLRWCVNPGGTLSCEGGRGCDKMRPTVHGCILFDLFETYWDSAMTSDGKTTARGYKVLRCSTCYLPPEGCICPFTPTLHIQAQFWLLIHPDEYTKPTNTARLIGAS